MPKRRKLSKAEQKKRQEVLQREAAERKKQKLLAMELRSIHGKVTEAPKRSKKKAEFPLLETGSLLKKKVVEDRNEGLRISSGTSRIMPTFKNRNEQYAGEMAEREKEAQKEIERKSKQVAPAYNKGGYQYISAMDVKSIGRKNPV